MRPDDFLPHTGTATPRRRLYRRLQNHHEVRARRRRVVGWAAFGLSSVLMVNALVGENGYLATLQADREYASLQERVDAVHEENRRLEHEVDRLDTDPAVLEGIARKELGLVKPGETVVILKDRPGRR